MKPVLRKPIVKFVACALLLISLPAMALAGEGGIVRASVDSVSSTFKTIISKAFGVDVVPSEEELAPSQPQFVDSGEQRVLTLLDEKGDTHAYQVGVARSYTDMSNGLMWRKEMSDNAGMIFVFADSAPRHFWMKNTYIALDMLFMDGDGTILYIHEGAKPLDMTQISSNGPAQLVLELNAGQVAAYGYKIGDIVGGAKRLGN